MVLLDPPAEILVGPHTEVNVKARRHVLSSIFADVLNPLHAVLLNDFRRSMMRIPCQYIQGWL